MPTRTKDEYNKKQMKIRPERRLLAELTLYQCE